MLIITADDYGKTRHATDSILECFSNKRVTSAAAMVFMEDSERAATLTLNKNLEVGLHLNFTEPFTSKNIPLNLNNHQNKVVSYLKKEKISRVVYNPFLKDSIAYLFRAQQDEFTRIYKRSPGFINGHHHVHLCANVLASNLITKGFRVRGTFTLNKREKNPINRLYRNILDTYVSKKFISTDSFFAIDHVINHSRLRDIFKRAENNKVEIVVHPENIKDLAFLLSDQFKNLLDSIQVGYFKYL